MNDDDQVTVTFSGAVILDEEDTLTMRRDVCGKVVTLDKGGLSYAGAKPGEDDDTKGGATGNPDVDEALAASYRAEAEKHIADARLSAAVASGRELENQQVREQYDFAKAGDTEHLAYHFNGIIDDDSVRTAQTYFVRWARLNPGKPMTMVLHSEGGQVNSTMHLYDFLTELKEDGHELTIKVRGWCASGASILAQAASPGRLFMGANALMLIHKPSGVMAGSMDQIEDQQAIMSNWAEQMLGIYEGAVNRRRDNAAVTRPLSLDSLRAGWNRKDWTLSASQCLEHGLIDAIG